MRDHSYGKRSAAKTNSKGYHRENEKRYCIEWGRLILAAKLLWPNRVKDLDALLTDAHRQEGRIYSEERYLRPCRIIHRARGG